MPEPIAGELEFLQSLTEAELSELVLIPLLSELGYSDVRYVHGPYEIGRDIVCQHDEPLLGDLNLYPEALTHSNS